jgi:predicted DNA-binding transcriptional regulator YafY
VPVAGDTALLLAGAIRRRRRLRAAYRSFSGERTRRELSPHGLVVHSGRWYLAAHDHTRGELRTFRVDRMRAITATDDPALAPPDGFDAVAYTSASLARVPWPWEVEVLLDLPVDRAVQRLPGTMAELAAADGGTLLRMRVSSLDWMAAVLAGLNCAFTIRRPDELRTSVHALADRLARWA